MAAQVLLEPLFLVLYLCLQLLNKIGYISAKMLETCEFLCHRTHLTRVRLGQLSEMLGFCPVPGRSQLTNR